MRRLVRAKERGDEGAVAVLAAIVVVFVLLPLSALAVSSYTRSSVGGEVNRAADSGALAGATGLGLLNLGGLSPTQLLNPLLPPSTSSSALQTACLAAQKAYGVPNPTTAGSTTTSASYVSGPILDPTANPNSPVGREFADLVGCTAQYAPAPIFSTCVGQITGAVNGVVNGTLNRFAALPTLLRNLPLDILGVGDALAATLEPLLNLPSELNGIVLNLLPALTHNGVIVDLDYTVEGPYDTLLGKDTATLATVRSSARRVFKPLLPAGISSVGSVFDSPTLTSVLRASDPLVTAAEALVVAQLQLVLGVLRSITDPTGVPASALMPLVGQVDGLLQSLIGPVLNTVTGLVPLPGLTTPSISSVAAPCLEAVDDLLADLQSALTINYDPADQDLLPCLTENVLKLTTVQLGRTLRTTQACANRIFRSQISGNQSYLSKPRLP